MVTLPQTGIGFIAHVRVKADGKADFDSTGTCKFKADNDKRVRLNYPLSQIFYFASEACGKGKCYVMDNGSEVLATSVSPIAEYQFSRYESQLFAY